MKITRFQARHLVAVIERERKLAITVGLILLALVFTFLLAFVTPLVLSVMEYRSKSPFRPFFTIFITLNGILNPMINCGRNETIRRSARRLFDCKRHLRHFPSA